MRQLPVLADVLAERPDEDSWDVIVIGAGMGGGTAGLALAEKGHRVLFVEKGDYLFGEHDRGDGTADSIPVNDADGRLAKGYWPGPVKADTSLGNMEFHGPYGCGTGGSTSIYASQLERMRPEDFEPRRHHPLGGASSVPETWPFAYEALLPYYRRAERLYDVCGTPDPLLPDPEAPLRAPPEMSPRDALIFDALDQAGAHPYRAHVGALFKEGCTGCGGALCPRGCKAEAGRNAVLPALQRHGARILPRAEVLRLEADKHRVQHVVCRVGEQEIRLTAKVVVLAAGALMSPVILLRSRGGARERGLANASDQVGRNLMMHAASYLVVRPKQTRSQEGPHKAISTNHFYVTDGHKLGNFHSMGVPIQKGLIANFLQSKAEKEGTWYLKTGRLGRKVAGMAGEAVFGRGVLMATTVEDLPYSDNRVVLDDSAPDGRRLEYTYPDELATRMGMFDEALKKACQGRLIIRSLTGVRNLNWGHVCGTCRAGDDPSTSVVDAHGRSHELENLYVADSSFFPAAGGVNPSLTIAANALRIADHIDAAF